jgi:hypothetical protein
LRTNYLEERGSGSRRLPLHGLRGFAADDAGRFEMTAWGASAAGRLGSNTRGEIKMLVRSAVDAMFILSTREKWLRGEVAREK